MLAHHLVSRQQLADLRLHGELNEAIGAAAQKFGLRVLGLLWNLKGNYVIFWCGWCTTFAVGQFLDKADCSRVRHLFKIPAHTTNSVMSLVLPKRRRRL